MIGPFGLHASSQIVTPTRTPADDEQRAVDGRRREVALLVEDRVVRQQVLAVDALHLPVGAHRGRVGEVAARLGEADDRGDPPGARRELLERLAAAGDERRPQQQVLGRVAGDRQLRERDEVAAGRVGPLVGVEDARRRCRRGRRRRGRAGRRRGGTGAPRPGYATLPACPAGPRCARPPTSPAPSSARRTPHRPDAAHPGRRGTPDPRRRARDDAARPRRVSIAIACASRSLASAVDRRSQRSLDPLRDAADFAPERTVDGYRSLVADGR